MKKKCLLTIILIGIMLLIISNKNEVLASDYEKIGGIQQFVAENGKEAQVGKTLTINLADMYQSTNLYCVRHDKKSTSHSDAVFRVMNYIYIDQNEVTSYHFPDGNSNSDANNDYSRIDVTKVTTVKENSAAALSLALSGIYGQTRYRTNGTGDYTETQKMVWPAFYYFLNDLDGETGLRIGAVLGLDANTGSIAMEPDSEKYRLQLYDDLKNGAKSKVSIYFLRCIDGGALGASQWQQMIIAVPEDITSESTVTINKVDGSSNVRLSKVSFIIKSNAKNQYVQNIAEDGTVTYTADENSAYKFTTGISTYSPITVKGLEEGYYTIKEVANLNPGYNTSSNIGKEQVFLLNHNASLTLTMINYSVDIDDDDSDSPPPEDNPGSGNVTISGTVWEDKLNGKANSNNSKKESGESGIAGVKVYWKDSSGNTIASDTTDSSGYYEMASSIRIHNHTYSISSSQYNKLNNSYIEFEYNGLKYTTVKPSTSGSDTSKGTEIADTRKKLDESFDEVNDEGVIDNGLLKYRLSYNFANNKSVLNQSISDFRVKANTKLTGVNRLLDNYAETEEGYYCVDEWECEHEDDDGDSWSHTVHEKDYEIDEWHVYNMNLGLVQREQPDIAITSDIEKVRVIMKGQEYTYEYNKRNISKDQNVTDYCVSYEKKNNPGVYTRPVNPSDIAYIQQSYTENEMEVYVTYIMRAKNQSNTLSVKIGEIVNYYDDDYELTSLSKTKWSTASKRGKSYNKNGYNAVYTTALAEKQLAPGQISDIISIEYKVKNDTVKSLINKENTLLRNVVEINAYTTYYGANSQCAENKTASQVGKTNAQYSGVDLNSAPGSATPGNGNTYEDDTEEAPIFKLTKNPDYKIISGTVWEDTQTTASKNKNERLGDGVKAGNENCVENVRVELYKAYDEGEMELAKIYRIENGKSKTYNAITYTDSNGHYEFEGIVTDSYILKFIYGNDKNATYAEGQKFDRETKIKGNVINARNYKSTIVTQEPVKTAVKEEMDDEWHLTLPNNASIAVDDLSERLSIPSLQYSNFNTPVNMVAYSPLFRTQIEYEDKDDNGAAVNHYSKVEADGGDFENDIGVFDFGIIERPREDIVIDKTIDNLKITLANGQILTEGNPYKDKMNYVKPLGDKDIATRKDALKAKSKLLYIEMDSELIQGSRLDIRYAITVTNNSEIDYEYDSALGGNEKYYYYGEVNSSRIKPSVELVVDYVDTELTCTTESENNKNWLQVQAQELKDNGLISEATFDTIKPEAGNYLIFVTDIFKSLASGESHTEYLFATKLLANQAEDYTYENHAEILKLNGKIARNIDSTESTGKQVTKTYKPGTYIPSLTRIKATYSTASDVRNNGRILTNGTIETAGLHNQDDDMITIKITPPTGLENNITIYIITAVVALIIIAGGIYFIKKKVL